MDIIIRFDIAFFVLYYLSNTASQQAMTACSHLLKNQVNWTACVDVNKVNCGVSVEQFSTAGHGVCMCSAHLHTKHILTLVSLQQCPLTRLTLGKEEEGRDEIVVTPQHKHIFHI